MSQKTCVLPAFCEIEAFAQSTRLKHCLILDESENIFLFNDQVLQWLPLSNKIGKLACLCSHDKFLVISGSLKSHNDV